MSQRSGFVKDAHRFWKAMMKDTAKVVVECGARSSWGNSMSKCSGGAALRRCTSNLVEMLDESYLGQYFCSNFSSASLGNFLGSTASHNFSKRPS